MIRLLIATILVMVIVSQSQSGYEVIIQNKSLEPVVEEIKPSIKEQCSSKIIKPKRKLKLFKFKRRKDK
jgi:hypothetical protein